MFLYSCEWAPRVTSLYFLVNAVLRDRDRSKAVPFLPFIKLLCTAVQKVLFSFLSCLDLAADDFYFFGGASFDRVGLDRFCARRPAFSGEGLRWIWRRSTVRSWERPSCSGASQAPLPT